VGISPSHEPTAADIRLTGRLVRQSASGAASWDTGIIYCRMIIGAALVAVLTVLRGLVGVGRCWRVPASRSVIPGGDAGVAIVAMPER
jgi:hypothetical protein